MKKQYEAPKVEIEEFEMENTLCTSCGGHVGPIPGAENDGSGLWP